MLKPASTLFAGIVKEAHRLSDLEVHKYAEAALRLTHLDLERAVRRVIPNDGWYTQVMNKAEQLAL